MCGDECRDILEGRSPTPDTPDPFALAEYVQRKIFLSDINNEREEKNPIYKQRILGLESFVMSYSTIDEVHSACTLLALWKASTHRALRRC